MSRIKSILKRPEWLEHVNAWHRSGLTQAAYCRDHQLNATTFNGWIVRDRSVAPATVPLTTVPMVIQPSAAVVGTTPAALVLQHSSGWKLALPADVQINWLARLLGELA